MVRFPEVTRGFLQLPRDQNGPNIHPASSAMDGPFLSVVLASTHKPK
jgi:hypothetical protein